MTGGRRVHTYCLDELVRSTRDAQALKQLCDLKAQRVRQSLADGAFREYAGYIPGGGDIIPPEFITLEEAKAKCECLPGCQGITFAGVPREGPIKMFFKNRWAIGGEGWTSIRYTPVVLWQYAPPIDIPISIRVEPLTSAQKTEDAFSPGDVFGVSESFRGDDGITYLRLADGRGWVFNRLTDGHTVCVPHRRLLGLTARASSGLDIQVVPSLLAPGDLVFTDRDYTFTSLGAFAGRSVSYVRPPNGDKKTPAHEVMWTLEAPEPVTVYLDFWGGEVHVSKGCAAWLQEGGGWERTMMLGTEYSGGKGPGIVFKRDFPAGPISILGNAGGGVGGHGVFYVFVEPRASESPQDVGVRDFVNDCLGRLMIDTMVKPFCDDEEWSEWARD